MTDDGVELTAPDPRRGLARANDILRAGYRDSFHEQLEHHAAMLRHLGYSVPPMTRRERVARLVWRWREQTAEALERFADRVRGF